MKKLREHDKKFVQIDRRFVRIDERFVNIDKRFDDMDQKIDRLMIKIISHDEDIQWLKENIATKSDICELSTTLDIIVGLIKKTDTEVTMITHGMRRMEDEIEKTKIHVGLQ